MPLAGAARSLSWPKGTLVSLAGFGKLNQRLRSLSWFRQAQPAAPFPELAEGNAGFARWFRQAQPAPVFEKA